MQFLLNLQLNLYGEGYLVVYLNVVKITLVCWCIQTCYIFSCTMWRSTELCCDFDNINLLYYLQASILETEGFGTGLIYDV